MNRRIHLVNFLAATPGWICRALDWCVKVSERLLVLGVALLAFRFGYHFYRGSLTKDQQDVITFLANNWKIVLILMIPLFYQTVRTFLEEVQEAWGIKRIPTPKDAEMDALPQAMSSVPATPTLPPEEEE
ncbi:hypothetical protein [Granulicella paludicola]|uniref:hypothetical protein n=1 Tax=Granulicella paludicola TaxID=474951 RepID=UPI0021E0D25C|nr:hypothetical protein [Granulicella paludicola]